MTSRIHMMRRASAQAATGREAAMHLRLSFALVFMLLLACAPAQAQEPQTMPAQKKVLCVDCPGAIVVKDNGAQAARLIDAPEGVKLIEEPGIIVWTPTAGQAGQHVIKVGINQGEGERIRQYDILVKPLERVLFVFAHSDDEFPIFSKLIHFVRTGKDVRCIWLVNKEGRHLESQEAMDKIGLPAEKLFKAGQELATVESLKLASDRILALLEEFPPDQVYMPQYECGHNQHDMAHFCALDAALRHGFEGQLYEFGLYNFHGGGPNLFSLIPAAMPSIRFTQDQQTDKLIESLIPIYKSQKAVTSYFNLALTPQQRCNTFYRPVAKWDFTRRPHTGMLWYELRANTRNDVFDKVAALTQDYLQAYPRSQDLVGMLEQDRPPNQLEICRPLVLIDPASVVQPAQE